ncbi:uncharacterized protein LOC129717866 [Wyeomyia smithii]|uniref:uncharacterized protein LOC129717866 n=1 Tax=Wyeomyia smithii TaxID=174621 RepID=UPI002467EA5F|nr:uncharacterized protein LOC129717866 [Wyeomyia smithii]
MDEPNTNWALLRELKVEYQKDDKKLVDLGSCGLHILHGAFKDGVKSTKWDVDKFLRAIYNLYKDVPARRALYTQYTGSSVFPLKFCSHRWLENVEVAQRAINVVQHMRKFVESVKKDKVEPSSNSFKEVVASLADPLLCAKLAFFKSVAVEVEPFLKEFQTDDPMVPFLYATLCQTLRNIMECFMKFDQLKNITKVTADDVKDSKHYLSLNDIVLGLDTKKALRTIGDTVKSKDLLQFRTECRQMLVSIICKMLTRSPLSYPMTKAASCFDPAMICADPNLAKRRAEKVLSILTDAGRLTGPLADRALKQFRCIIADKTIFDQSDRTDNRVDHFWIRILEKNNDELSTVIKMVSCLSHGNANVERGFSINAECLFENMHDESLEARRQVYDAVCYEGGIEQVSVTKELIHSVRNARARIMEYKERCKKESTDAEREKMLERQRTVEVEFSEKKRKQILSDASKEAASLEKQINQLKK